MARRRQLSNATARYIALSVVAEELWYNEGGDTVNLLMERLGGSDYDGDAVRRYIRNLSLQLTRRAEAMHRTKDVSITSVQLDKALKQQEPFKR